MWTLTRVSSQRWYTYGHMLTRYARKDVAWIDLVAPTPEEVRGLMHEFGIDPLVAEELLLPSFKPKVERRADAIYVILHFPTLGGNRHSEQEIDFVIGKHFLITTHYESIDPLHSFAKAFEVDSVLGREGTATHGGHLFAFMTQNLYKALGLECESVSRRLREIEEKIFGGDEKKMVVELSHAGRTIHDFHQALTPHQEMLKSLEPVASRLFGGEFSYHVRNLEGAWERVERTLEHLRDALKELRETNNSLLSTKQNEIMKILTIMAFVTFPLTLISSIFGMNTQYLPVVGQPGDFWFILGFMSLLAMSFFVFFKHKKWL